MNKSILSVITPTLNNGRQIGFFLKSLLSQSRDRFALEVIISDGGSCDNTEKIAKNMVAK